MLPGMEGSAVGKGGDGKHRDLIAYGEGGVPAVCLGLATAKWSYWVRLGRPQPGPPPALCSVLLLP